ncbi:thioredoxin [Candidatus Peregrinibacteria bacterium HGW-Peregrinibacteria-1]|jgi:thioredoxin 1|nr:MAG: thioredoxin [Candidatus Peregrinibacteria bacterium HGW-Peregrinibacteria-1]
MAHMFTTENFDEEVTKSSQPVMVDFYAEWCGPCKMLGPIIEELATEHADKWKIGKVNIDENHELAAKFGVQSIPTIVFIKDGEVVDKVVGFQSKEALTAKLNG